jgi:hypothetical protein
LFLKAALCLAKVSEVVQGRYRLALTLSRESLSVSSLAAKPRIDCGASFLLAGRDVAAHPRDEGAAGY